MVLANLMFIHYVLGHEFYIFVHETG